MLHFFLHILAALQILAFLFKDNCPFTVWLSSKMPVLISYQKWSQKKDFMFEERCSSWWQHVELALFCPVWFVHFVDFDYQFFGWSKARLDLSSLWFWLLCRWKKNLLLTSCIQLLWHVTVATRYCFYYWEQLISISKAQIQPELWPQISENVKRKFHECRAEPKEQREKEEVLHLHCLPSIIMAKGHIQCVSVQLSNHTARQ